jgi:tripartite-type tricarboxylate transporter receptor subunit TctC
MRTPVIRFWVITCAALGFGASLSCSQTYPAKPVRVVVAFAPGGAADVLGRVMASQLTQQLGQQFIVDDRAGAGGAVGIEIVARAKPDGYTLLFTSSSLFVNTTLFGQKFKFDPTKDLAPVIWTSSVPLVLTLHPSVPVKSVKELVALSKRYKTGLNGGHNGSGTTSHIALEMFVQQAGANLVQIPYKGGGPTIIALPGGEIDFCFSTLTTVKPHVERGRLRGIAVSTKKRSSIFPDLPTMDSIYPGFESDNWFAMFVPAATPKEIIGKLHSLAVEALKSPELHDFISKDGGDVVASTPEQLGAHLRGEIARYAKVIRAGNIKAE